MDSSVERTHYTVQGMGTDLPVILDKLASMALPFLARSESADDIGDRLIKEALGERKTKPITRVVSGIE